MEKPQEPTPPEKIELTITRRADGRYRLDGPIDNPELCYAMLGMANQMLTSRVSQQHPITNGESRIVSPHGVAVPPIRAV